MIERLVNDRIVPCRTFRSVNVGDVFRTAPASRGGTWMRALASPYRVLGPRGKPRSWRVVAARYDGPVPPEHLTL